MESPLRKVRRRIADTVKEAIDTTRALTTTNSGPPRAPSEEPPVVARLVVEVRSDGSHTIARGAIEDVASGERVALQAEGTTPAQLAASLAKSLVSVPLLAAQAARALRKASTEKP